MEEWGGGEGRKSYLWGVEERRRGFRKDSYKAIGTHIRHFQLHRVKSRFREESVKQRRGERRTEEERTRCFYHDTVLGR